MALEQGGEALLGLQARRRWRRGGRPGAAPPRPPRRRPWSQAPPPRKTASGRSSPASASGRMAADDREARHAERGRVARRRGPRVPHPPRCRRRDWRDGAASIRSRPSRRRGRCPRGAAPLSGRSAESVTARISRLVSWPSWSKSASGQAGGERDRTGVRPRRDLDRQEIERVDALDRESLRGRRADALARAAQRLEHGDARGSEAEALQKQRSDRARRSSRPR